MAIEPALSKCIKHGISARQRTAGAAGHAFGALAGHGGSSGNGGGGPVGGHVETLVQPRAAALDSATAGAHKAGSIACARSAVHEVGGDLVTVAADSAVDADADADADARRRGALALALALAVVSEAHRAMQVGGQLWARRGRWPRQGHRGSRRG